MAKRITRDSYFIGPLGGTFEDKFIDGTNFEFYEYRGSPQNSDKPEDHNSERGLFRNNDTVIIKYASIDQGVFQFYRIYDVELGNRGNPFAPLMDVKTNLNGCALGVFAGFGTCIDTVYLAMKEH